MWRPTPRGRTGSRVDRSASTESSMNVRSAQAPMWDLVEESLDEAEFLWRRWEAALSTHARDLAGVRFWVEERLLGSLDGLRAAGTRAYDPLLIPALAGADPFRS